MRYRSITNNITKEIIIYYRDTYGALNLGRRYLTAFKPTAAAAYDSVDET